MPIQLYHPNKSNLGSACSFNVAPDNSCVFATLIRQHGWDAEKGNGTFKGNKDNPEQKVNVKLSLVEVSAILETLDRKRVYSAYHDADKPKQIKFDVWVDKASGSDRGFTFSVNVSDKNNKEYKNSFYFGFNYGEARYVREYLMFCLKRSFKSSLSASQSQDKPFVPVVVAIPKTPTVVYNPEEVAGPTSTTDDDLIGDL